VSILRDAPPRQLVSSLSHGAEWKTLFNKYIWIIPVNGDASCVAEHNASGMRPSRNPVRSATIAKVGAAASDSSHSALALRHSRRLPPAGWTRWVALKIIRSIADCSHCSRRNFNSSHERIRYRTINLAVYVSVAMA
jgi:hypothetical protein